MIPGSRHLVLVLLASALAACGGPKAEINVAKRLSDSPTIAVVVFASQPVNAMHHTVPIPSAETNAAVDAEVAKLESHLQQHAGFQVKPLTETSAMLAEVSTASCPQSWRCAAGTAVLGDDGEQLKKAVIPPDTAASLCQTLGVDYVMAVYTEWWLAAGFKKKTKVKAVFKIYDAQGKVVVDATSQGYAPAGVFPAGPKAVVQFDLAADQAFQVFARELGK